MLKKSIVLSDPEHSSLKAVLTMEEQSSGIYGTLRLYNFPHEPNGILSLGIFSNKKVYKAGLTLKSHMLYEFFVNIESLPQKFSCAIVNFQNAQAKPLLYGSSEGSSDDIYGGIISEISEDDSFENTKKVLDKHGVNFDEEESKQIEEEIDKALCSENCATCIYKKFFYENAGENKNIQLQSVKTGISENIEENPEKNTETKNQEEKKICFFDKLKPQIDKLFEQNPTDKILEGLIPDSKWVKVDYEDEGDFFVFGLLYDDKENVRYVCYGVPAVFDENPPEELDGYPIWLPLDDKQGFGYWMTYQDATTGEPVKAIMD